MNSIRPPYFIGFALTSELSERVFSLKCRLHEEIAHSLKPLVPHVTLLHPSSLRNTPQLDIIERVRTKAEPYLPLALSLETVEAFDRAVLYIRVRSPELEKLQLQVVDLLPPEAQVIYRSRPYVPHITLVQVRTPHTLDIEALRQYASQEIILPYQIKVDSISCFTQTRPREYLTETI